MLLRLCLAFLAIAATAPAGTPGARAAMDKQIRAAISQFKGSVWLYARNLDTGETYGIRETERVRTASTIKLPILVAVHAAAEAGKLKLTERITMNAADKVGGSGVLHEFSAGESFQLGDLCNLMIVVSDNTATNLVLDRVTPDYVNQIMDSLNLPGTRAMRKILGARGPEGFSKAGSLEENQRYGIGSSTPKEMVTLLEGLHKGTVINAEVSKKILEVLKRQQYKVGIGRIFDDKMPVMSKSGALDALRSDAGLIFTPAGKFAISITVDNLPVKDYSPDNVGNKFISELTGYLLAGLGQ